jgi:hypothetical protein
MTIATYDEYVEIVKVLGEEIELTQEEFDLMEVADKNKRFESLVAMYKARKSGNKEAAEKHEKEAREMSKKKKMAKEEVETSETEITETQAADTLKPNSRPVPHSRMEMMTSVMSAMGGMPKKDLVKWFDQAMAVFGPNKDLGVPDNSAKNAASIDTTLGSGPKTKMPMQKLNVKEDVEEMFAGQDLSEEFKGKATTLFEAAVNARVVLETARIEEEFENTLNEQVGEIVSDLTEKVDQYLDFVVETWMKDNEVAIETSLRNELVEDFIEGLRGLFSEHYISVPQEKLDILEALSEKVAELEEKLDETISENVELRQIAQSIELEDVFDTVSEGLALTQVERFRSLAEGIEFDGDLTAYERKLNIIKEQYFTEKTSVAASVINEDVSGENSLTEEVVTTPEMKRYALAISRTIKK